jgi:uncharacterized BrkB/YihY/UPF0761 family membrane protein
MHLRFLRLFLVISGLTWFAAIAGVFLSWPAANELMRGLGAEPPPHDPMLDYWLRMASGAFGLIGVWFFLLAARPGRFRVALVWAGGFMVAEGTVLLAHGFRLGLPAFPFYGDVAACLVGGAGILFFRNAAEAEH